MHINSISKIEEVAEFISMMNKDITTCWLLRGKS